MKYKKMKGEFFMIKLGDPIFSIKMVEKFVNNDRKWSLRDKDLILLKKKCLSIFEMYDVTTVLTYDAFIRIKDNFIIITPIFTDDEIINLDSNKYNIYIYLNPGEHEKIKGGYSKCLI